MDDKTVARYRQVISALKAMYEYKDIICNDIVTFRKKLNLLMCIYKIVGFGIGACKYRNYDIYTIMKLLVAQSESKVNTLCIPKDHNPEITRPGVNILCQSLKLL